MNSDLIYNIVEQHLRGRLGHVNIDCVAGSGGRAGTKTKGAENFFLKNNALATHVHSGGHTFGPLPQGYYYMYPHEDRKKTMVRLDPFKSNVMHKRSGFLIHGRGEIGSHGCIVPYDFADVQKIYNAVRSQVEARRKMPVLKVVAVGTDIDRKFLQAGSVA